MYDSHGLACLCIPVCIYLSMTTYAFIVGKKKDSASVPCSTIVAEAQVWPSSLHSPESLPLFQFSKCLFPIMQCCLIQQMFIEQPLHKSLLRRLLIVAHSPCFEVSYNLGGRQACELTIIIADKYNGNTNRIHMLSRRRKNSRQGVGRWTGKALWKRCSSPRARLIKIPCTAPSTVVGYGSPFLING